MDNLLSSEEVRHLLEIDQKNLDRLIEQDRLSVYKIGGSYLRFRKEEVLGVKRDFEKAQVKSSSIPWSSRARDFWRFNNFYILSLLLIAVLFFFVVRP